MNKIIPLQGAGVGIRAIATIIDTIVFMPITYLLAVFYGTTSSTGFELQGIGFVIAMLLGFIYYILMEGKYGATLGKMAVGLKVVKVDGNPCDMKGAIIRTLGRIIDSLPFLYLIGIFFILFTARKQRVGDSLAGTIVMRKSLR